ncbi:MAG: AAA family ATPase [Cyanobacteria bacterium P01_A01_bin.116]
MGGAVFGTVFGVVFGMVFGVVGGMMGGVVGGIAFTMVGDIAGGVVLSIALGVALSATVGAARGVSFSAVFSIALGVALGATVGLTLGVALGALLSSIVNATSGTMFNNVVTTLGFLLGGLSGALIGGVRMNQWRQLIMPGLFAPWHLLLYRLDYIRAGNRPSLLHRHLAFWDESQSLKIRGLDKHLLLVIERSPAEGQAALNYLSTSGQREVAQAVQIELDARQLENCSSANAIGTLHQTWTLGELTGPANILFRSFNRISEDIGAALSQISTYNQRLALSSVRNHLSSLTRELTRSSAPYAARLSPIAHRWANIIELHLHELTKTVEQTQEIDSPYIIGVPLTERQDIFVGRTNISIRIEQLLLDRRRPPLLLYGQRRTGKTSLLNNLGKLLPNSIVPLFVDLQGPAARASNHAGFLYNLAKGMTDSAHRQRNLTFPPLTREALTADPFTTFDEWLDTVETTLANDTALLALDEFEVLDQALTTGKFNEADVLGMLRNLIQHRPRFKVLFSGSHTLQEFQRWSSYLINAQVLHLGTLKESEARQLIEQPSPDFALRYEPDACQRVLAVTRCHPYLVQSLCAEIVVLKNEQDPSIRRLATLADVEAAIPEALDSGSMFFSDIEINQVDAPALALLKYIATQGEAATVSSTALIQQFTAGGITKEQLQQSLSLLIRRELIEKADPDSYRIQIELFRRWFAR